MKKVKHVAVLAVSLVLVVFCCFSTGCELKGNFFDESARKNCEISFLQKPENVSNESYFIEDDWYHYNCEMESIADFKNYAESVLLGFIDNNYTFGYFVEIVRLGELITSFMCYNKIYPSLESEDYKRENNYYVDYNFYYTKKPYDKLKEKHGGRFLGHRRLLMCIDKEVNENGKYNVEMEMYGGNSKSEWGNYIFEKGQ